MKNIDALAESFVASWNRFVDDLVKVAALKVAGVSRSRTASGQAPGPYEERLIPLIEKMAEDLRQDQGSLLRAVHADLIEDPSSWPVLSYLRREFEFFEELVADSGVDSADDLIEAGQTIKTSFEEIVPKLPGKFPKTLRVLDSVLDLLRKAA